MQPINTTVFIFDLQDKILTLNDTVDVQSLIRPLNDVYRYLACYDYLTKVQKLSPILFEYHPFRYQFWFRTSQDIASSLEFMLNNDVKRYGLDKATCLNRMRHDLRLLTGVPSKREADIKQWDIFFNYIDNLVILAEECIKTQTRNHLNKFGLKEDTIKDIIDHNVVISSSKNVQRLNDILVALNQKR